MCGGEDQSILFIGGEDQSILFIRIIYRVIAEGVKPDAIIAKEGDGTSKTHGG